MELSQIYPLLLDLFPQATVTQPSDVTWQVELPQARLLAIASSRAQGAIAAEELTWLRILLPLAPQSEAQDYLEALLEANFETQQRVHYALHQGVLWAVAGQPLNTLTPADLTAAIEQARQCQETWLRDAFLYTTEKQIRQIIQVAKQQGQSLEATLQNIGRFYAEGILGGLEQTPEERESTMAAWQARLTQLWETE
ncbi:MAG: hypothetical protein AAGG51_27235 [Cyanobacteria bacterium P01_G01_bin.54]